MVGPFVQLVPDYQKWATAVLPLQLFAFNGAWAAISTPLTNAFNAIGKIKLTFKLMILWTALTWILTPLLAIQYGYLGAAVALVFGEKGQFGVLLGAGVYVGRLLFATAAVLVPVFGGWLAPLPVLGGLVLVYVVESVVLLAEARRLTVRSGLPGGTDPKEKTLEVPVKSAGRIERRAS